MIPIQQLYLRKNGEGGRTGSNRSGEICHPQLIIIHRTGNPGSSAKQNRDFFDTETISDVYASAHYCVDSKNIIKCLPEIERGIHCAGVNFKSIGIETCEPLTKDTYKNVIDLIVDICLRRRFQPNPDFIQPHSKYDDINRRYDPFRWADFVNGKANSGQDLFNPFMFYADVEAAFRLAGGKLS